MGLFWNNKFWPIRALAGIANGRKAYGGPVTLNLGLTDRCNLRCIHCRYHSPKKQTKDRYREQVDRYEKPPLASLRLSKKPVGREADSRFAHNLIEEVAVLGTPRLLFAGDGEPFLHRNALDLMARAKHLGLHTTVFTNGTQLDRETVDELIRIRLDVLRVSILGASAQEYADTHSKDDPAAFDQLKSRLLQLLDRKKSRTSVKPRLVLYTTALAQNFRGLRALADLAVDLGADAVVFLALDDIGDEGIASLSPNEEQVEIIHKQAESVAAHLEEQEIQHNLRAFLNVLHQGRLYTGDIYQKIPCYYGWLASVIKPDGNVFFCCSARRPIGNLNEQTFTNLWRSSAYARVRNEAKTIHIRGTSVSGSICHKCVHYAANQRVHSYLRPFAGRRGDGNKSRHLH